MKLLSYVKLAVAFLVVAFVLILNLSSLAACAISIALISGLIEGVQGFWLYVWVVGISNCLYDSVLITRHFFSQIRTIFKRSKGQS